MTPEAQRIAIAEACGWRFWQNTHENWVATAPDGREIAMPGTPADAIVHGDLLSRFGLPDYLADLNAMHAAIVSKRDELRYYCPEMRKIIMRDCEPDDYVWIDRPRVTDICFYEATCVQKAEAFLRALKLWDNSK